MDYKINTIANGLRILTVEMPALASVTVTVWVKTGSRNEKDKIAGVSHFMEHMAFKGGKKYKTPEETSYVLDALGAESNAGTAQEWTNFYIKVRSEKVEKAFEILSDVLLFARLDAKEIEKEKGVILEEMAMHEDNPMWNIADVFNSLIFQGNSLGRDIAGTKQSVRELTRPDFIKYRQRQYVSENMLITVAGGVRQEKINVLAEKYFGALAKDKGMMPAEFKSGQNRPRFKFKNKKTEQGHFILGYFASPRGNPQKYAESLLSAILGRGFSSRLFSEIREKRGLAYSVHTSISRYMDVGDFSTYVGVKLDKIEEAISVTVDQINGLREGKYPVTQKELVKVKEYIKGRLALALEDTENVNDFFGEQMLFVKDIRTPDEEFERIDRVTIEEVHEAAKRIFDPNKLNLAIIGPYKNQNSFVKLLQ